MATLTVWKFDDAGGAEGALQTLDHLRREQLITLHDAAVVTWPAAAKKPKTRQLHEMTGAGAMGGAFWGFLFGLIFFVPLLGMAVGAAVGAMSGSLADVGIDDDFIKEIRQEVTPGTSALFLLTSDAVMDRIREAYPDFKGRLIHTNLAAEEEAALRGAFGEEA